MRIFASPFACTHSYESMEQLSVVGGEAPSFPIWPLVKPVTAGLVLPVCNSCTGEDPGAGAKLTHTNRAYGSLPPGQSGEVDSTIYMNTGYQAPSSPWRGSCHKDLYSEFQAGSSHLVYTAHFLTEHSDWRGT